MDCLCVVVSLVIRQGRLKRPRAMLLSQSDVLGSVHTYPVPESCMLLKPVMLLRSVVKPPWFDSLLVSATAFAMPYGSVAPENTLPVPVCQQNDLEVLTRIDLANKPPFLLPIN
jgi:hypothetical protein